YLRLHRDKEAVAKLKHYLDLHPDENGARLLLAKIFIHQHAFDKAIAQFQLIHRHNPGEVQSLLLLSELYISRRQPERAVNILHRVLDIRHNSYPAHVLLARLFAGQGKVDPALKHYRKALALNQSTELEMELGDFYLQQKRYGKAARLYEKIVSREPDNEEAGMVLVHVYLLRKKEKKALAELERLKNISYDPGKIEMTIAGIYARKNQYEKAVAILQRLVMRENLPKARYMLGILFFQLKKYQEALFQLQQIPVGAKDYDDALFLRVRLLRLLKRTDEAVSVLEKALLQNSDVHNADLYALLARLYQAQGKTDLGEKTFARILPMYPENERLLYEYGLFLDQAGDQKKAMTIMQKVISLRPEHAAALNYVGYTWAEHREHLDKALDYIRRAVTLKPNNGYIRDSLGWIYFRLGHLREARRELLKAAKLAADDPAILDHLGDVYLASGQQKMALQAYRRALEKYTEDRDKIGVKKKIRLLEEQLGK
ncbi:MAG TPA: tetratricopeptide repeat protein, partial [Desulfobulbaceae bacterium]|nr:tetratricopeptide repeat protein [Desulfobulbaceae bacterium]